MNMLCHLQLPVHPCIRGDATYIYTGKGERQEGQCEALLQQGHLLPPARSIVGRDKSGPYGHALLFCNQFRFSRKLSHRFLRGRQGWRKRGEIGLTNFRWLGRELALNFCWITIFLTSL